MKKVSKKRLFGICTLIANMAILYRWCSLPILLMLQGYTPNDYTVYENLDDVYQTQILKVYTKNRDFKYIEVRKNQFGLWELNREGELCTAEDLYTSLRYEGFIVEKHNESFRTDAEWRKVFEIKKTVKDINFNFDNLPKEVNYELAETDESYIVELSSRDVPVAKISLDEFVDGIEK